MKGSLRITEQGEIIAAKYAEPRIAHRNLETLLAATLAFAEAGYGSQTTPSTLAAPPPAHAHWRRSAAGSAIAVCLC